jgi:hypothetical protein
MENISAGALKSKFSILGIWGLTDPVATAKRRLLEADDVLRHGRPSPIRGKLVRTAGAVLWPLTAPRLSHGAAPQRRNSAAGAKSNNFQEMSNFAQHQRGLTDTNLLTHRTSENLGRKEMDVEKWT